MTTKPLKPFAWLAVNEADDGHGFYLEDGEQLRMIEVAELRKLGAPDTEQIEIISILPEDRDSAMVEAKVTDQFIAWAKSHADANGAITDPVDNGESNLVYYDNEDYGVKAYIIINKGANPIEVYNVDSLIEAAHIVCNDKPETEVLDDIRWQLKRMGRWDREDDIITIITATNPRDGL